MARPAEYIDITSALTLAAFGLELTGDAFAKTMNAENFGMERKEAIDRLLNALMKMQRAVLAADLVLIGRFVKDNGGHSDRLTHQLPPVALSDYAAFDYTINGLRHGEPQLLWFPTEQDGYVQPKFSREDFYKDVKVVRGQVRKFLGVGKSPVLQAKRIPPLPEADLIRWFENLSPEVQQQSIEKIYCSAVEQHPEHKVPRSRVRELIGKRTRGRPPKNGHKENR